MSLITVINTLTGIILSADSRTTGLVAMKAENGEGSDVYTHIVLSDTTQKLFIMDGRFAVGCFGDAVVDGWPVDRHFNVFQDGIDASQTVSTQELTIAVLEYFRKFIPRPSIGIIVAGYDNHESHIYSIDVSNESFERKNFNESGNTVCGLTSCGDTDVVDRLFSTDRYLPRFEIMNNTDAVEYSRYLIELSAKHMQFETRPETVGGPIDTVVMLPNGKVRFIYKKEEF